MVNKLTVWYGMLFIFQFVEKSKWHDVDKYGTVISAFDNDNSCVS